MLLRSSPPSTRFQPSGATFLDIDPVTPSRTASSMSAHGTPRSRPSSQTIFSAQSSPCGRPWAGTTTGLNNQSCSWECGPASGAAQPDLGLPADGLRVRHLPRADVVDVIVGHVGTLAVAKERVP